MRTLSLMFARASALAIAYAMSGCTLLGAGVGAGIDAMIPGPYEERNVERVALKRRNPSGAWIKR